MADPALSEPATSFGPFRLIAGRRLLLEGDQPVRIGSRAFDILTALIERPGEVIGKDELIARVWPTTIVEEGNLKLQVSALRRVLGDGRAGQRYILNVPGRGYNFVAPVIREDEPRRSPPQTAASQELHNLPVAVTRMIGREDTVPALVKRLSRNRLVTIVGPAGIGKTTVALAVAESMVSSYEHGVWLVDLAPLSDARLVPSAVATVLGLEIHAEDPLPSLIANLRDKLILLLLDNCEHVIDAAAVLATALLRGAAGINILATSREPLAVDGEREYRLRPLAGPPRSPRLSAADAMAFPAVQLFVERATAAVDDFVLSDTEAPLAVEICHKLDGLPLAIEFAAARVEVLGVQGLAAHLDNSLQFLGTRRRGAVPRHGTMRAALDWSYRLLSEDEQQFFDHLAIFVGSFTVDAATATVADARQAQAAAIDRLADLVAKSLVSADVSGSEPRFRLLDTTRAYALEKLAASGERKRLDRLHAEYYQDIFERAEAEVEMRPRTEWLADYRNEIDNLRTALDWAFSPGGDASIGVALAAAALPVWMHLALLDECRSRAEQALAVTVAGEGRDARRAMKLHAAVGASLIYTKGAVAELGEVWTKVLELAESVDDPAYRLHSLWGLWAFHSINGRHATALEFAQEFHALAVQRPNPNDRLFGQRIIGLSRHALGDHAGARQHFERVLADYAGSDDTSLIVRFQIDLRVAARVPLALVLWLQGCPDQARQAAERSIEDARGANHPISLSYALGLAACPIALLNGDLDAAEQYIAMLLGHSMRETPAHWRAFGSYHKGVLTVQRGDTETGLHLLRSALDNIRGTGASLFPLMLRGEMAEALGRAGEIADGLAAIDEAIASAERTEERWAIPELLRVKGELLLLPGASASQAAAEDQFRQAIGWARRQRAFSWELRIATSLARLRRDQHRRADALALLQPVYDRFTEGFDTGDLKAAKVLLDALQ